MRDLTELGMQPRRRNPYPPATDHSIAEFELHFGLKLPASYVRFLKFSNGGYAALSDYDYQFGGIGGVNDFYGLGTKSADDDAASRGTWDIGNLWGEVRARQNLIGAHGAPFARDGGDNQLYIDLSSSPPSVHRLVSATRERHLVARSFESFIDMLRPPAPLVRRARKVILPKRLMENYKTGDPGEQGDHR